MRAMLHEQEGLEVLDISLADEVAPRTLTRRSAAAPQLRDAGTHAQAQDPRDPPDGCHRAAAHGRRESTAPRRRHSRLRHQRPDERPERAVHAAEADPAIRAAIDRAWIELKQTGSASARDMLIIHYMAGHVRRVAHRMSAGLPRLVDPDDLSQHVYRVLTRLIDRFDPTQEVRFETFSTPRLTGAMRDYLRDLDTAGRQERQRCKKMHETVQRHLTIHGRKPEPAELKSLLGIDNDEELQRWMDDARAPATVSFASGGRAGGGSGGAGGDHFSDVDGFSGFADPRQPAPPSSAERDDLKRWLTTGLPRRDRLIIILYYYEQMTMKEIGTTLGCSESRVSQRLDSILECLRARLTRLNAAHELK